MISTTLPEPVAVGASPDGGADNGIHLAKMTVGMTASGSQDEVLAFVRNLEELDRVMLITSTTASTQTETGKPSIVSMQVQGSMFVLQSKLPDLVSAVSNLLAQAQTTTG
jgi:hypothetical protein